MKYVEPKVPEACIRDGAASTISVCGDYVLPTEHAFNDMEHAIKNYASGKFLRACPRCVATYRARQEMRRQQEGRAA